MRISAFSGTPAQVMEQRIGRFAFDIRIGIEVKITVKPSGPSDGAIRIKSPKRLDNFQDKFRGAGRTRSRSGWFGNPLLIGQRKGTEIVRSSDVI